MEHNEKVVELMDPELVPVDEIVVHYVGFPSMNEERVLSHGSYWTQWVGHELAHVDEIVVHYDGFPSMNEKGVLSHESYWTLWVGHVETAVEVRSVV